MTTAQRLKASKAISITGVLILLLSQNYPGAAFAAMAAIAFNGWRSALRSYTPSRPVVKRDSVNMSLNFMVGRVAMNDD